MELPAAAHRIHSPKTEKTLRMTIAAAAVVLVVVVAEVVEAAALVEEVVAVVAEAEVKN